MSIDMVLSKWAILTIGVYGEIVQLLSDPIDIYEYIKNVDTYHESFSVK